MRDPAANMAIELYDLAGAEPDRRFSPYCWRTRMALAHKGLEVETIPWRFTEKERKIRRAHPHLDGAHGTVPVYRSLRLLAREAGLFPLRQSANRHDGYWRAPKGSSRRRVCAGPTRLLRARPVSGSMRVVMVFELV